MREGAVDDGLRHLAWIARFQVALGLAMAAAWLLRSREASAAFLGGAALSLAFWHAHCWMVARMLTPSVRRRWFYALLTVGKLALIAYGVRAMMACFPREAVPLATGILLFVGGILLEAARLILHTGRDDG